MSNAVSTNRSSESGTGFEPGETKSTNKKNTYIFYGVLLLCASSLMSSIKTFNMSENQNERHHTQQQANVLQKEPIDNRVQALLKGSDDFDSYGEEFVTASVGLMNAGTCTLKDFAEGSGWVRSTTKGAGVYFLYCGNHLHRSGRLYLNARTGNIFR